MTSYELAPCPACGAARADEIASAEDVRAEFERLWRHHSRRIRPDTPAERLVDRLACSQRPAVRLARCLRCGTVYRNPREREAARIYRDEDVSLDALRHSHDIQRPAFRKSARKLRRMVGPNARALEVGCFAGAFLSACRDAALPVDGVDINETAVSFCRDLGFDVRLAPIEEVPEGEEYDAVAIVNCFDQLPDPVSAARHARRLLRRNGVLLIRVPNGAFYDRLREHTFADPLLAANNLLSFPYRTGFTPRSLRRLLAGVGFRTLSVRPATVLPSIADDTRKWARMEERLLRTLSRPAAPWFELWARAGPRVR